MLWMWTTIDKKEIFKFVDRESKLDVVDRVTNTKQLR